MIKPTLDSTKILFYILLSFNVFCCLSLSSQLVQCHQLIGPRYVTIIVQQNSFLLSSWANDRLVTYHQLIDD